MKRAVLIAVLAVVATVSALAQTREKATKEELLARAEKVITVNDSVTSIIIKVLPTDSLIENPYKGTLVSRVSIFGYESTASMNTPSREYALFDITNDKIRLITVSSFEHVDFSSTYNPEEEYDDDDY